jgi:hypothetical protein
MFESSIREIEKWLLNVFQLPANFNVSETPFCTKIMICHIYWGGESNQAAMLHQIRSSLNMNEDVFGGIKKLNVLRQAKLGKEEPDTVAFLEYEKVNRHWYAIAFYNKVFRINGIE